MKKHLLASALLFFSFVVQTTASAQTSLAPDQNPAFAVSRDKYLRLADSMNAWHGTTFQQTYKAFDWYENKMERKEQRRQFRREIRSERARNYNNYYSYPGYQRYRGHNPYYRPRYFRWF